MAEEEDKVCGLDRNGGPLPFMFLQRIQNLKGNDVCFDCGALDPDWYRNLIIASFIEFCGFSFLT